MWLAQRTTPFIGLLEEGDRFIGTLEESLYKLVFGRKKGRAQRCCGLRIAEIMGDENPSAGLSRLCFMLVLFLGSTIAIFS